MNLICNELASPLSITIYHRCFFFFIRTFNSMIIERLNYISVLFVLTNYLFFFESIRDDCSMCSFIFSLNSMNYNFKITIWIPNSVLILWFQTSQTYWTWFIKSVRNDETCLRSLNPYCRGSQTFFYCDPLEIFFMFRNPKMLQPTMNLW